MGFFSKTLDKLKGALRKTAVVLNTDVRILWAFETDGHGGITLVPHTEETCIWLSADDVATPEEVEL